MGRSRAASFEVLDDLIEPAQEARAVFVSKRRRPARDLPRSAQRVEKVARRQEIADVFVGEKFSVVPDDPRAGLDRPVRERHIRRDDDIAGDDVLHDPVIRRVKAALDDDKRRLPFLGQPHPRIGYERHPDPAPPRHAHDLRLHGTGIGVDVDVHR